MSIVTQKITQEETKKSLNNNNRKPLKISNEISYYLSSKQPPQLRRENSSSPAYPNTMLSKMHDYYGNQHVRNLVSGKKRSLNHGDAHEERTIHKRDVKKTQSQNFKIPEMKARAQVVNVRAYTVGHDVVFGDEHPLLIQAKLTVNRPDDEYEREADQVADRIISMVDTRVQWQDLLEEKLVQPKSLVVRVSPSVQRQVEPAEEEELEKEEEEEPVQTKLMGEQTPRISSNIEAQVRSLRNSGQPLPKSVRNFFEPRFGHDFSQVRVHTGPHAVEFAQAICARAFTTRQDIVFSIGAYAPETEAGRRLLAHELTHVLQQQGGRTHWTNRPMFQRLPKENTPQTKPPLEKEKRKIYPPVNWAVDRQEKVALALPKAGVTLDDVAQFLYGSRSVATELAKINKISPTDSLEPGSPLRLLSRKLTAEAFSNLEAAPKVPIGVKDPTAYLAQKKVLDTELEHDFTFIISKLNETNYSDTDEKEVISVLRRWGEETFTTNPELYPKGGQYLDQLFTRLTMKTKDVGIVATQYSSYYSLIFNHFDRADEVRAIRDQYSRQFKGDSGQKELSFGADLWQDVKDGKVRDRISAYFRGVGKGLWSGAKGTVTMAYKLVTNPKQFFSDIAKMPATLRTMWENRNELWNKFANASPERQAEMIGEVFGEIEFMIASGGAAKGVAKLAEAPGKLGKIARGVQAVTQLPQEVLGAVVKGAVTTTVQGVRFATKGAIWVARGIYRVGRNVLHGTWSVVEKTVGKVKQKLYYFYHRATGKLHQIPEELANECVHCSSPCNLTAKGVVSTTGKKVVTTTEDIFAELTDELGLTPSMKIPKKEWMGNWSDIRKDVYEHIFGESTLPLNKPRVQISVHHVREKFAGGGHSIENLLPILHDVHNRISGIYNRSVTVAGNKMRVRDWIKGLSPAEQRGIGYKILFENISKKEEIALHKLMEKIGMKTFYE